MTPRFPPPNATRAEIDRFFGKAPPEPPRPSFGARMVMHFFPGAAFLAAVHHTIDELDALECPLW